VSRPRSANARRGYVHRGATWTSAPRAGRHVHPIEYSASRQHRTVSTVGTRSDIWLLSRDGTERRNLTRGAITGAGYFIRCGHPMGPGSPCSRPRARQRPPLCWHRGDSIVTRLSERGVDLNPTMEDHDTPIGPIMWLDATHILCVFLPPGEVPYYFDRQTRVTTTPRRHGRSRSGYPRRPSACSTRTAARPHQPRPDGCRRADAHRARSGTAGPAVPERNGGRLSLH